LSLDPVTVNIFIVYCTDTTVSRSFENGGINMTLLIVFRLITQVEECPERQNSMRLKPPAIFVYSDTAGFELFTEMWLKIPFFWNVRPCELVKRS